MIFTSGILSFRFLIQSVPGPQNLGKFRETPGILSTNPIPKDKFQSRDLCVQPHLLLAHRLSIDLFISQKLEIRMNF